jgi:hypothetical protein
LNAIAVNANAVFLLSQVVAKRMLGDGWGRIINVTTSLGTMLREGYCPYGPTKAAAEGLSAVMASDLNGSGVTVNVLVPGGIVNTPMIPGEAPFLREELIQPEAMLAPLYWLCSSEANDVTGLRFLANQWDDKLVGAEAAQLAGAPMGETEELVSIKLPDGSTKAFSKSDVVSKTPPVSVMPPMLGILNSGEIRDVVEFLSSQKFAPKADAKSGGH